LIETKEVQFIPEVKIGNIFGCTFKHQDCLILYWIYKDCKESSEILSELRRTAEEIGYILLDAKIVANDIEKIEDKGCVENDNYKNLEI
jgi:hypothetical protein